MRKTEDITNLHYTHNNEMQFEYGGQTHHYNMDNLKKLFINYWNSLDVLEEIRECIMQPNIEIREYYSCDMDYSYVNEKLLQIIDKGIQ